MHHGSERILMKWKLWGGEIFAYCFGVRQIIALLYVMGANVRMLYPHTSFCA